MPEKGRVDEFGREGLQFDVRDTGPLDGNPVVLLHGFPQDSTCWRLVMPRLNEAGLRTLAPDQRGYSPRARPSGRSAYRQVELVDDVIALIDHAGFESVHLVGHDLGGAVGWATAAAHPDRVASMTVLSTPHPIAFRDALAHGQALRSWYFGAVQLPFLPEVLLLREGRTWAGLGRAIGAETAQHYRRRLAEPGAATAALNWYRAIPLDARRPSIRVGRISVPTKYLWGEKDPFLVRAAAERTAKYVRASYRFEPLARAGHWLPERNAEQVADAIAEWANQRA